MNYSKCIFTLGPIDLHFSAQCYWTKEKKSRIKACIIWFWFHQLCETVRRLSVNGNKCLRTPEHCALKLLRSLRSVHYRRLSVLCINDRSFALLNDAPAARHFDLRWSNKAADNRGGGGEGGGEEFMLEGARLKQASALCPWGGLCAAHHGLISPLCPKVIVPDIFVARSDETLQSSSVQPCFQAFSWRPFQASRTCSVWSDCAVMNCNMLRPAEADMKLSGLCEHCTVWRWDVHFWEDCGIMLTRTWTHLKATRLGL